MKIGRCDVSDAKAVAEIEQKYIECPWNEAEIVKCIGSDDYVYFKATESGETIGYIGVMPVPPEYNICNVAVMDSARRKGVATALMAAAEELAAKSGGGTVYLEVNETNAAAIALYRKRGYEICGKRPRYYGEDAAINMKKEI